MHNQSVFLKHYFLIKVTDNSPESSLRQLLLLLCQKWDPARLCFWILENFVYGPWKMGILDQSEITSKVLSFLQFSIAIDQGDIITINNKQTKHYLSKICWLHAAILAKVYLTWLTYTGKYIFLQLRPNCLKNMLKHERKVKLLEAKEGCGPEQVRWWWLTCPRPTGSGWSLPLPRTFRPDADFDFFI